MNYTRPNTKPLVVDFQRQRVYDWQARFVDRDYPTGIPREAITLLFMRVEAVTGVEIAWRYNPRAREWAWGGEEVVLPNEQTGAWAYSVPVALHEAAHVVLKRKGICDRHGPRFVGLFLQLLKHCGGSRGKARAGLWATNALEVGVELNPNMKDLIVGSSEGVV